MQWRLAKITPAPQRSVPARIFFWLAVVMVVAWLLARWWGITDPHAITRGQRQLLIAAGILLIVSWLPLPRFPKFKSTTALDFPTKLEISVLVALACLSVAVEVAWSRVAGLLAYPPIYDGISYMFDSKRTMYLLGSLFERPEVLRNTGAPNFSFTPLWKILMMIHYWLLGIGEWQAYTVRFWPIFLLILLIFWLVGRQSNRSLAWVAVAFTLLLPTLNISVRATILEFYFPWSSAIGWYLADLRPDLLFAVLLVWATVPLIQFARQLDSRLWLISGTAAGLTLMTKPSALTLLFLAWSFTLSIVLLVNQAKLKESLSTSIWGFGSFLLIVMPWIAFGGLGRIFRYIYRSAVSQRELWSDANATLWSEFTYYWNWYSIHMGFVEGWLLFVCALSALILRWKKNNVESKIAACGYLLIALVLYGIVSASPSKNFFLGLPFFLILWFFSWTTLGHLLDVARNKSRILAWLPGLVAIFYVTGTLSAFGYAAKHWPDKKIRAAAQSRAMTALIVDDLSKILTRSEEKFLSAPLFGIPATAQYYMMLRDGSFPRQCPFDPLISPPERATEKLGSDCKAILLYRSNDEQRNFSPAPKAAVSRWEAITAWVKRPYSGYHRVKAYQIFSRSPGANIEAESSGFTMELYVLETPASGGADS